MADKEAGSIICKGMFPFSYGKSMQYGNLSGNIHYSLLLKFKDNKFRVIVKDFNHETSFPGNMIAVSLGPVNTSDHPKYGKKRTVKKYWTALQAECYNFGKSIASDLHKYIVEDKNDDW